MWRKIQAYLRDTRRPVYSAALVAPFFLVYHTGTFFLRTTYINGADALIIRILSLLSVHSVFASALVLLGCFVVWQLRTRASWKIEPFKVTLLFFESCFFAVTLYFLFGWFSIHLSRQSIRGSLHGPLQKIVLYCGAGVYEELLFRGFLLGILLFIFGRILGNRKQLAAIWATVTASLLFALFHYVGPAADSFTVAGFFQRTLGGLYFSILFVTRGFGVTAAAHALYDILVGVLAP